MKDTPPLKDNNDFLKDQGSPYIWMGLLLVPLVIFIVILMRRPAPSEAPVAPVAAQQAPAQQKTPSDTGRRLFPRN